MELNVDFEPPEKRILSWLSQLQTSASIESVVQNNSELPDEASRQEEKHWDRLNECYESGKPRMSKHPSYERSGLKKYFVLGDSELSSFLSDDSESVESLCCRRLYCYRERKSIVDYIVKKNLFSFIKGNYIWKQMERERICARSWQSMKAHFHKYICQHLEEFSLKEEDRNCFLKCMKPTSTKLSSGTLSVGQRGWRKNCKFYTFMEDALILYYVLEKKRYELTHGNAIWRKLENSCIVAERSWQSLKTRYKNFLAKYIERLAPINKYVSNIFEKRLDCFKKLEILQDFLLDNLMDIAICLGAIPSSNMSVKELKHLGLDCTFAIPLPYTSSSVCEREVLQQCVLKIVQQLADKIHMLLMLTRNNLKNSGNIKDFLPPKYSSITDLNILHVSYSAPENVAICHNYRKSSMYSQQQFQISPTLSCDKQLLQKNPRRNVSHKSVLMNAEKATSLSPVTSDPMQSIICESDRILINEMQYDSQNLQSRAETCIIVSDITRNVESSSVKKTHDYSHFVSAAHKTDGKIVEVPESYVETSVSFETQARNGISDPIFEPPDTKCEDKHNELPYCEEFCSQYSCGDLVKDKSMLPNAVTENTLDENKEYVDVYIDESFKKPIENASSSNNGSSSFIDVVNVTSELTKENEEDKIVQNNFGCCKLFDIPYPCDKKCDKMYSSLLKCILGTGGRTLKQINEGACGPLLEYHISAQEDSNCELIKSSPGENSTSVKTRPILEYVCESQEGEEQELSLQLGSEDSGSEI